MIRIADFFTKHLVTAANADYRSSLFCQLADFLCIAFPLQIEEVFCSIFASRNDDQVRISKQISLLYKAYIDIRFVIQSVEICEVGNLRSLDYCNMDIPHHVIIRDFLQGNGVLIINAKFVQIRNNA